MTALRDHLAAELAKKVSQKGLVVWQDSERGHARLVLVSGEAGIGKTVLLREFTEHSSVPVLWGMCDSLSTPRPLGPLRDVADWVGQYRPHWEESFERLDAYLNTLSNEQRTDERTGDEHDDRDTD